MDLESTVWQTSNSMTKGMLKVVETLAEVQEIWHYFKNDRIKSSMRCLTVMEGFVFQQTCSKANRLKVIKIEGGKGRFGVKVDSLNTHGLTARACSLSLWSWASSLDILTGEAGEREVKREQGVRTLGKDGVSQQRASRNTEGKESRGVREKRRRSIQMRSFPSYNPTRVGEVCSEKNQRSLTQWPCASRSTHCSHFLSLCMSPTLSLALCVSPPICVLLSTPPPTPPIFRHSHVWLNSWEEQLREGQGNEGRKRVSCVTRRKRGEWNEGEVRWMEAENHWVLQIRTFFSESLLWMSTSSKDDGNDLKNFQTLTATLVWL